uniref:C-type lectin domain-containing protein n=1 Tax=Scleropages formosus TaxID=113540 RepID=A0A8C9R5U0_SCLFO
MPGNGSLVPKANTSDYKSCPQFWHPLESRCFKFVSEPKHWIEAQLNCIRLEGSLASVHNMNEYRFVQRLTEGSNGVMVEAWLGGTDAILEGTWIWIDSTLFDFTFWSPGEPNNDGNQNCLQINYGDHKKWDDLNCYKKRPSICVTRVRR